MSESQTGRTAETFFGDKLYQQRARAALPLLVRQAKAQKTIFYSDLAEEMGMANPRTLNFVLGSVGQSLLQLGREQGQTIPPIQCLVINKTDRMPGDGVDFFITRDDMKKLSKPQRRAAVEAQLSRIYAYPEWDWVLDAFSLPSSSLDFSKEVRQAGVGGRGGGESPEHLRLKQYVASNPRLLGLRSNVALGVNEYVLPSGDEVDVLFRNRDEWVAVEVKSRISDDNDLVRGLFQCVKYQAVLEAFLVSTNCEPNVRTLLVTTRHLSAKLISLKNVLGIEVLQIEEPCPAI